MSDLDALEPSPDSFAERIGRIASRSPTFTWRAAEAAEQALTVSLKGSFTIEEAPQLWRQVVSVLESARRAQRVSVDLGDVTTIDGACMALLVHMQAELRKRRIECTFANGSAEATRLLKLYGRPRLAARRLRRPRNGIEQLGQATVLFWGAAAKVVEFIGELLFGAFSALRRPRSLNLRDIALTMERAGADALPIVLLINFLIGFVMAYQSAAQLRQFGANIFVADLVGLAMTRELGPLMTAIIVCGRTGAAFAAELGTMKVSEEVDALRTLGLLPMPYLVLPRVLGLMLVAPVLTVLADAVGIGGGVVVAATQLDVTPAAFIAELQQVMAPWDVLSGVMKSFAFSATIGIISCQQGLSTTGGAEGVGRRTTGAVVAILFTLILLDAVFTVLFGALGL